MTKRLKPGPRGFHYKVALLNFLHGKFEIQRNPLDRGLELGLVDFLVRIVTSRKR